MSASLWVVRHAPVAVQGLAYGSFDVPVILSADEAAQRIAAALPSHDGLTLIASPLRRCREPAERLARAMSIDCEIDPRLAEIDLGRFEGRAFSAIEREEPVAYARWLDDWRTTPPPDGEPYPRFLERVTEAYLALCARPAPTLAVTHAGVIRLLRALSRGSDPALELGRAVEPLVPEPLPTSPR